MSSVPGQPGGSVPPGAYPPPSGGATPPGFQGHVSEKTPWTAYIKPGIWVLVAIYAVAFVFLNAETVDINFIFFTASVPLIFVLIGMGLIGAGLYAGVMMIVRRRAAKKQAGTAQTQVANGKK